MNTRPEIDQRSVRQNGPGAHMTEHDLATKPRRPDATLGELLSELTSEFSTLVRTEVELAKTEAREELADAGKAGAMFAGAAIAGWMALIAATFALAWWIDEALDTAVSFLIVAAIWAVVMIALALMARRRIAELRPLPETTETLKEDVQWAKAQTS